MIEQKNYTYGMVFLVTIMVTILFLWASVLIMLKYHGDTVGCAAGIPFRTSTSSNQSTVRSSVSHRRSSQLETLDSSSLESRTGEAIIETAQTSNRELKEYKNDPIKASKRRQRRTRIVFVFFGLVVLVCTSLLLVFSFSAFQGTLDSTDQIIMVSVSH